ncbi:MAG: flavin reductase family protein, partial [Specibacter sp.]
MKGAPPLPATTNTEPAAIHPDRYREVMRHHPTGVAAVSSLDSDTGEPCGLVVGTLASLSLEPALITFSVNRS